MSLKLPLSLHEATIEKFRARDRVTKELVPDDVLEALHSAMASARADADRIAALHEALSADKTITPEAAALKVRKLALQLGDRASAKLDKARAHTAKALDGIRKATWSPPPPKDLLAAGLETEIRARMALMPEKDRSSLLANAIAADNELIVGACLRGPAMLSGMSDHELELRRALWREKNFPDQFDREQRLWRALDALDRGGASLVKFIAQAADTPTATAAEESARRSAEAVAAAMPTAAE